MWIKPLPDGYCDMASFCFNNVFLWQSEKVFVMDNHMAALWGWLQVCNPQEKYNFMHIDRHYDMLVGHNKTEWNTSQSVGCE